MFFPSFSAATETNWWNQPSVTRSTSASNSDSTSSISSNFDLQLPALSVYTDVLAPALDYAQDQMLTRIAHIMNTKFNDESRKAVHARTELEASQARVRQRISQAKSALYGLKGLDTDAMRRHPEFMDAPRDDESDVLRFFIEHVVGTLENAVGREGSVE